MPAQRSAAFLLLVLSVGLLGFAPSISAQCTSNSPGYMDIGLTPGNPFQAEKAVTQTGTQHLLIRSLSDHPQLIARDSQGRVRMERVTGKFKMDSGPEQGQELEQHIISICDPVAQTLTQLDTVNKTAKITPSLTARGNAPATPQISLCAMKAKLASMSRFKSEDLGHKTIQGLDAQGFRFTMSLQPPSAETSSSTTREVWCAEELSAVIQENLISSHNAARSETALTKIERIEPDPALFQIPPGYTISELIPPKHQIQLPRPALPTPGPSGSSSPASSPQN